MQTIASFVMPRRIHLPAGEERLVEVAPGIKVRCWCYWQVEKRTEAMTLIVVHGLEGSTESQYMTGVARDGLAAGMNVVLMNQRNCGGMDHCAPTLYNSSLSGDVAAVARNVLENDGVEFVRLATNWFHGHGYVSTFGGPHTMYPPLYRLSSSPIWSVAAVESGMTG